MDTLGIFVAGDPVVDQFILRLPPPPDARQDGKSAAEWELYDRVILCELPGGSRLTYEVLRNALPKSTPLGLANFFPDKENRILHSLAQLCLVEGGSPLKFASNDRIARGGSHRVRIQRHDGYRLAKKPEEVQDHNLTGPVSILVLNDAGGEAQRHRNALRRVVNACGPQTLVLHKRHLPLGRENSLRRALGEDVRGRAILHVGAVDLRRTGLILRSDRSWKQARDDLIKGQAAKRVLIPLLEDYAAIIVQCGAEGAFQVVLSASGNLEIENEVFDPALAEGEAEREPDGLGHGVMNAFLCGVAMATYSNSDPLKIPLPRTILNTGLAQARVAAVEAFDLKITSKAAPRLLLPGSALRPPANYARADGASVELAIRIVEEGRKALNIPYAVFGELITAEEEEMIAYRAAARLMADYAAGGPSKPLSLAVFGKPGSGKSFGVSQIADLLKIDMHTFNLSEADEEDLPGFFHEMRDATLRGRLPLCFLDEFDSNGGRLVARFLAPMQDGLFRQGPRTHPLGRAILVFAGGTAATVEEFRTGRHLDVKKKAREARAKALKLPDFVSRLRGKIEIVGLGNPDDETDTANMALRRALMLRSMIIRHAHRAVIGPGGRAQMDETLIRAFLTTADFQNDARSMEQIVLSSALSVPGSGYHVADLPPRHMLDMHLRNTDRFLDAAIRRGDA